MSKFLALAMSATAIFAGGFTAANAEDRERNLLSIDEACELLISPQPSHLQGQNNFTTVVVPRRFDPITRISLIIPTYRELYNGNVARILKSISEQMIDPDLVELVFVVNNTPEIAKDLNNPTRVENMKTIAFLRAVKSKFKIRIVDLATNGTPTNMGFLRQIGSMTAINSSKLDPKKHVIMHMDADTIFAKDFFLRIYDLYSNYAFDAVFVQRQHTIAPDVDDLMLRTFYQFKLGDTKYKFTQAMYYAWNGVATPQISSRATAFKAVGGFPLIRQDEDFKFTMRLSKTHNYYYAPDINVTVQDRAREDGFDAKIRNSWNSTLGSSTDLIVGGDVDVAFPGAAINIFLKLQPLIAKNPDRLAEIYAENQVLVDKLFGTFSEPKATNWDYVGSVFNYLTHFKDDQWWGLHFLNEDIIGLHRYKAGVHMLMALYWESSREERRIIHSQLMSEIDQHDLLTDLRIKAIENLVNRRPICTGQCLSYRNDPFISHLLDVKSVLHNLVKKLALEHGGNLRDIVPALTAGYGDWLLAFYDTPTKSDMFCYRMTSQVIVAAHNEPARYPKLSQIANAMMFRWP